MQRFSLLSHTRSPFFLLKKKKRKRKEKEKGGPFFVVKRYTMEPFTHTTQFAFTRKAR